MATLTELRDEVAARMSDGESFSTVEEDVIDPSWLSSEQKSALWLYGWSFVGHGAQRQEAEFHLARLGGRD